MNVELPTTGCNILISSSSFYNYSPDLHTRDQYYIYDGVAHKQSSSYSQYGYTYTGDCLSTGDLVYKPEIEFWYNVFAVIFGIFIMYLIARLLFRKWWRVLR